MTNRSNGSANGYSSNRSSNGSNGYSNGTAISNGSSSNNDGRLSLEEQHQRDIAFLRLHLQSKNADDYPARVPSPEIMVGEETAFPFRKYRSVSDGDMTVHTSNVSEQTELKIKSTRGLSWLRAILVDLPLLFMFGILALSFSVEHIYHQHYVPLLHLSGRAANDNNLRNELTYYQRTCSVKDMSSRSGEGLLLVNGTSPQEAVDNMMIHGTSVIPQILNPETAKLLRKFIMRRNKALTKVEKIPLSQGKKRVSFGIDATEDPILPVALKEVVSHKLFRGLITGLVGEDPAVTEITAITAAAGADSQVWHPDVKPDGNGIKFARTYSHSYSLFITLQDTTESMGPTTMCPGTHYCANDVYDMCDDNGFPLTHGCPDNIWRAGDGALLNQQVWHRGGKHYDKSAQERVVFIVSFIGRPDATRQLARGTYFHQKWLSWGHTMRDLMDAHRSMAKPFSVLRALSLWKPKNRNWGYDLITAAVMRIANVQLGMTAEELPTFQRVVVEKIFHIPLFLQGPVSDDEEDPNAWPAYLNGTLEKLTNFLVAANGGVMLFYALIVLVLAAKDRSVGPMKTASYRMLFTHGIPALLAWKLISSVANSEYWKKVQAGDVMRPPFGDHLLTITDEYRPHGPTTLPVRDDVLVGSRFDSMTLGAYDRWLDFHPGNFEMNSQLSHCARMPISLEKQCADHIVASIEGHHGRLLEQDWTTGDWHVMTPKDGRRHIGVELKKARNSILARIAKSVSLLVAHNRFDARPTALTFETLKTMLSLREKILADKPKLGTVRRPNVVAKGTSGKPGFSVKTTMPQIPTPSTATSGIQARTASHTRWLKPRVVGGPLFKIGDLVWINYKDTGDFWRGAITKIRKKTGAFDMQFDDGEVLKNVPQQLAQHEVPLSENAIVMFGLNGNRYRGTVKRVMPDALLDIAFGKDKLQTNVPPSKYNRIDL